MINKIMLVSRTGLRTFGISLKAALIVFSMSSGFNAQASTNTFEILAPAEFQPAESEKLEYETDLNFVHFPNTRWARPQIVGYMKSLAEVYVQCGIRFNNVKIYTVTSPVFRPEVEKYDQESPYAIAPMSDQTNDLPRPAVYLIDSLTDSGNPSAQEPFSKAFFTDFVDSVTRTHPSLADTVWLTYFVNTPEYTSIRNYNGLAHELTHVLSKEGAHNIGPVPNLMIQYLSHKRTNYILPEDCQLMLKNPLVRKVSGSISSKSKAAR